MSDAVTAVLRALRGMPAAEARGLMRQIKPDRLATLVGEARAEIGESPEEDLRACYQCFLDYLDNVFCEMPGVVETDYDWEGGPGSSSAYRSYWSEGAEQAADGSLRQVQQEAKSLLQFIPPATR
jgi:hypothetical protein